MKLKKTKVNGLNLWFQENDKFIGQRIALDKYEKYETAVLLSQITKNSVVVDVGANIGYYTLLMAKIAKKVYAFEPEIEAFKILKKNIKENGFKNVVLINAAVGDKNGEIEFVRDEENFGNHRIKPLFADAASPLEKREKVRIVKLDEVIKEKIDLIKIDTQGWEPQVINGAKEIIKRDKPIIFLEYTPADYQDNKMITFLQKNYKCIWSIDDFAEVKWPIWQGIKINGKAEYTDLWIKNKLELKDWVTMLKNVNYKKFIKGIIRPIWQK